MEVQNSWAVMAKNPNGCPRVAGEHLRQMGLAYLYHWLGNCLPGFDKTVSVKSRL